TKERNKKQSNSNHPFSTSLSFFHDEQNETLPFLSKTTLSLSISIHPLLSPSITMRWRSPLLPRRRRRRQSGRDIDDIDYDGWR
ncbi:unnamed protein product, partial [Linum tenue]